MSFAKKLYKQSGFTLIEMMVVVAIIGVLATLGKSSYDNYIESARQSEAKLMLPALAGTEEQFKSEYNSYAADINALRFFRKGTNFWYSVGFHKAALCGAINAEGTYGAAGKTYAIGSTSIQGNACDYVASNPTTNLDRTGCTVANEATAIDAVGVPKSLVTTLATTFTGAASGLISGKKTCDTWTITEAGVLTNTVSGK